MTQIILTPEDVKSLITDGKFDITGMSNDTKTVKVSLRGNKGTTLEIASSQKEFIDLLFGRDDSAAVEAPKPIRRRARRKKEEVVPEKETEDAQPSKTVKVSSATKEGKSVKISESVTDTDELMKRRLTGEERALYEEFVKVQVTNKNFDGKSQREDFKNMLLQGRVNDAKETLKKEKETRAYVDSKDKAFKA